MPSIVMDQGQENVERRDLGLSGWRCAVAVSFVLVGLTLDVCRAQCVDLSERVPKIALDTFSLEPSSLLNQLRNDKDKLTGRLTGYIITDVSLLPAVRRMVNDAPNADRPAIGAALRRAEVRCLAAKPDAARKINDFVRKLGDDAVFAGYAAEEDEPDAVAASAADKPVAPSSGSHSDGLLSGEWKTEVADPFAPVPVPQ